MDRSTWKREELWWAEQLGGRRVPVTGRQRGDAPDNEHPRYSIEVKAGRVMSSRMRQAMEQALACCNPQQRPLVCITQNSGRGKPKEHYVLMKLEDFLATQGGGA